MCKKRVTAIVSATGILALFALPASANIVVLRDAQNNVYVAGLTPGSSTEVGFEGTERTRNTRANSCGVVKLTPLLVYAEATQISLNGENSTIANLPVRIPGICRNVNGTYTLADSPTETRFKDEIGTIYIKGLTPGSSQVVSYPSLNVTRKVTANACGYFRLANTTQSPITNSTAFKINANRYLVFTTSTVAAPACKRVSPDQSAMMIRLEEYSYWLDAIPPRPPE